MAGLGTYFSLGVVHRLQRGAVIQDVTALHITIRHFGTPSVSTQIAALRRLLLSSEKASVWFDVAQVSCRTLRSELLRFS